MTDPKSHTASELLKAPHQIWRSVVLVLLAGLTAVLCLTSGDLEKSTIAGVNMDLPTIVGGYYGETQEITLAERTILPMDTEFARRMYHTLEGGSINCQIVLSGGAKRSIHRPEICLPGQGWTVRASTPIEVKIPNQPSLPVMKLTISRSVEVSPGHRIDMDTEFLYWFVGADTTTARHWRRILLTSWDRIFHGVNHRWAYVVVSSPITASFNANGKTESETLAQLEEFIGEMYVHIHSGLVRPGVR